MTNPVVFVLILILILKLILILIQHHPSSLIQYFILFPFLEKGDITWTSHAHDNNQPTTSHPNIEPIQISSIFCFVI